MNVTVLLCSRKWTIARVLRAAPGVALCEGDNLMQQVTPDQAQELEGASELECGHPLICELAVRSAQRPAFTFALPFHEHFLVMLAQLSAADDVTALVAEAKCWLTWADDNLPIPYQDDYYRIQRMNNRLLNAERALAKKSSQLERTLAEVCDANNVIALLERDRLTGLYTLAGLLHHAHAVMRPWHADRFDVMVFAVGGLRQVKELFGTRAADDLLRNVALFVGGLPDAQCVLLARIDAEAFYAIAPCELAFHEMLQESLSAYLAEYPLPITLQVTIGVCPGNAKGSPVEEACNRARLAFDQARNTSSGIAFYNQELLRDMLREHQILDGLPDALAQGQLRLYLQSKVDMRTGATIGAEALVRWAHPKFGLISPGSFIPLLEKHDRIFEVDRFIWEQTCKIQQARAARGRALLPISVNVSRGDFYKGNLVQVLCGLLEKYELPAAAIRLEVLERAYADDVKVLSTVLADLRRRGFIIEMDDFGTGESTLAMLSDMPIDVLKLDRGFVMNGLADKRRRIVIESVVNMAQRLDMEVIVEGVETHEQERYLLELGCRYAQGFLYAKPQPAGYFLEVE